jgi:PEP-CTERM motif
VKLSRSIALMLLTMTLAVPMARAAIDNGNGAELVFVLWDRVAKVAYTKDLGVNNYNGTDLALRRNSFFVYAQQDAGYQNFWSIDANDAAFAKFRSVATNTANMVWAVLGADGLDANSASPGDLRLFTTLTSTAIAGTVGASYSNLNALQAVDFIVNVSTPVDFFSELNTDVGNPFSSHLPPAGQTSNPALNGSSFNAEGSAAYFGAGTTSESDGAVTRNGSSCNCSTLNPVGKSSWFYYATTKNDFDTTAPVAVDEFDNLGHDGYFGFAQNPANGNFVLSYTLAAYSQSAAATTAVGKARASLTEYIASSSSRLLSAPVGEFAGYVMPLSPVPEPSSLLLMAGGLAGLVWQRRKRVHERMGVAPRHA